MDLTPRATTLIALAWAVLAILTVVTVALDGRPGLAAAYAWTAGWLSPYVLNAVSKAWLDKAHARVVLLRGRTCR